MSVSLSIRKLQSECKQRGIRYHPRHGFDALTGLLETHDSNPANRMPKEINHILKHFNRYSARKSNVLRTFINELIENAG